MFPTTQLLEAKDQEPDKYQDHFLDEGPISVYIRHRKNTGPLELELYKKVTKKVVAALKGFGIPDDMIKGKFVFDARKSPVKGSIGQHDPKDDMPIVFDRNDEGLLPYSKLTWTMAHELGHRMWRRMSDEQRDLFRGSLEFLGKKLDSEVLKLMKDQVKNRKKILDKIHYRLFDSLWWAFKLTGSKDPDEFYRWIKTKKVTSELPTEYAQVNETEAWAETFADLVLNRKKTPRNRRTGRFLRRVVRGIIDIQKESSEFHASNLS